jgi:hypothetical protein
VLKYTVEETDQFLKDVEESAVWILLSNMEQSESLAEKKVNEFEAELNSLKDQLQKFPESGEGDGIQGVRRSPIYGGRYSAKWIVDHVRKVVIFISLSDSKYPKNLCHFHFDD